MLKIRTKTEETNRTAIVIKTKNIGKREEEEEKIRINSKVEQANSFHTFK